MIAAPSIEDLRRLRRLLGRATRPKQMPVPGPTAARKDWTSAPPPPDPIEARLREVCERLDRIEQQNDLITRLLGWRAPQPRKEC